MKKSNKPYLKINSNKISVIFSIIIAVISLAIILSYFHNFYYLKNIKFATGDHGMSFKSVGDKIISSLSKGGYDITKIDTTVGSETNMEYLCKNQVDLALVHLNASTNCDGLSTIAPIYTSKLHVITSDTSIKTIRDINISHSVSLGPIGSGTRKLSNNILNNVFGVSFKETNVKNFKESINKLVNKEVDVIFLMAGANIQLIDYILSSKDTFRFVEIPEIEALTEKLPYLKKAIINKALYNYPNNIPFPRKNINTISTNTYLVASPEFTKRASTYIIKDIITLISKEKYELSKIVHPILISDKYQAQQNSRFEQNNGMKEFYNDKLPIFPIKDIIIISLSTMSLIVSLLNLFPGQKNRRFKNLRNYIEHETYNHMKSLQSDDLSYNEIMTIKKELMKLKDTLMESAISLNIDIIKTKATRDYISEGIRRANTLLSNCKKIIY